MEHYWMEKVDYWVQVKNQIGRTTGRRLKKQIGLQVGREGRRGESKTQDGNGHWRVGKVNDQTGSMWKERRSERSDWRNCWGESERSDWKVWYRVFLH